MALFLVCSAIFLWTAPGRIQFPDDEIVFQTTRALWERGSLSIEGIPKRTGEPRSRPDGTFGWAPGRDGQRYGFFGHGLSIVAVPAYALASATVERTPRAWKHGVRSDHYVFHRRSARGDWTRLVVSLTNPLLTAATACVLAVWLGLLGYGARVSLVSAVLYALGTAAWPYTRTFLSEPLSALVLTSVAVSIARFHRDRRGAPARARASLAVGGLLAGLSLHVHILNVVALPCFLGYAVAPLWREAPGDSWSARWRAALRERALWHAVGWALLGVGLLLLGHYLRFGSPFETGRFGYYSKFVWPWEGLAGQLVAPGRSFFLYAPAALVGLLGLRRARARCPDAFWFAVAIVALRYAFMATRSDWYGGWGIGPRYLVAVIPFAMLPLAQVLADLPRAAPARRFGVGLGLALSVAASAYLSFYSIFEWMWKVSNDPRFNGEGVTFMDASHWYPLASPYVGFASLKPDMLSLGAMHLASLGHGGLQTLFVIVAGIGVLALVGLLWTMAREGAAS